MWNPQEAAANPANTAHWCGADGPTFRLFANMVDEELLLPCRWFGEQPRRLGTTLLRKPLARPGKMVKSPSSANKLPGQGGKPMKLRVMTAFALAAGLLAGAAHAQQAAAPAAPDLNAIPDKMPFNQPYGVPITMDRAQAVIQAGIAEANKRGWQMNLTVVDTHGDLVAFARMDGAQLASIPISQHKARAAARYRRPTRAFEDGVQKFGFNYLMTLDDVIASRGGIPLVEGGKIIGAVGCSGGTGSQDEAVCTAAADTINKTH
jgi:glc operon protein GlcG